MKLRAMSRPRGGTGPAPPLGVQRQRPACGHRLGRQRHADHHHSGERRRRGPVRPARRADQEAARAGRHRGAGQPGVAQPADGHRADQAVRGEQRTSSPTSSSPRRSSAGSSRSSRICRPHSKELMTAVFTVWADTRSILVQAGSDATGQKPTPSNADKLLEAGLQVRQKWLKKARHHDRSALRARQGRLPQPGQRVGLRRPGRPSPSTPRRRRRPRRSSAVCPRTRSAADAVADSLTNESAAADEAPSIDGRR